MFPARTASAASQVSRHRAPSVADTDDVRAALPCAAAWPNSAEGGNKALPAARAASFTAVRRVSDVAPPAALSRIIVIFLHSTTERKALDCHPHASTPTAQVPQRATRRATLCATKRG